MSNDPRYSRPPPPSHSPGPHQPRPMRPSPNSYAPPSHPMRSAPNPYNRSAYPPQRQQGPPNGNHMPSQPNMQRPMPPQHQMRPGQQMPSQGPTRPGQPAPGQQPTAPGQPMPGQRPMMPGRPISAQRPMPPGQPMSAHRPVPPGRPMPGQRPMPPQHATTPNQPALPNQRPMPPHRPMPSANRPVPPQSQASMSAQMQPMRPLPPGQQNGVANGSYGGQGGYPAGYGGSQPHARGGMRPSPGQTQQQYSGESGTDGARLSSSMMPRPSALEKPAGKPRDFYHRGMTIGVGSGSVPLLPCSNADFVSVDDGSARIRFMRLTTGAIGNEPSLMGKSGVPLAAVMTPFADTKVGETPVPVVDFSSKQVGGPLRCERCNAYANPGFRFMRGGSQFQCNLCGHINQTPPEHFSPIAPATGLRMDADARPELRLGSVDYIVGSPDYCIRPPKPARYLYVVDVSAGAVASGLSSAAMMSIKSAIGAGLLPGSAAGARVGIMTFDKALHFFDARGAEEGKAVTMQYVPDINDPFVPIGGDALFLTPAQAVLAIDAAIETHGLGINARKVDPNVPNKGLSAESALGSALTSLRSAFADCGGKAFVVAGSLPSTGVSKLDRRGGGAIGGGEDREVGLLKEAIPNYEILGCELAEVQASVDLFLAPSTVYIDGSTLSRVPRACGGRMYMFTGFDPVRDGASLHRSLCAASSSPRAFEALMRVRTSPGLEARGEFIGHFARPQRGDDIGGPVFDSGSTLALEITVTSKLNAEDRNSQNSGYSGSASLFDDACVQCAVLFTDCAGRRRIRVHTVFATKTSVLQDVFKHADVDAVASFVGKKAASAVLIGGTSFSKACEAITEKTAQTLFVYRKHCTTASLSGQLILPEALKVLPVMMLGLIKSAAFRRSTGSVQSGDAVTVDERAAALSFLISGTPAEVAAMCYPRMWEIQAISDDVGKPLPAPDNPVVSGNGKGEKEIGISKEPIGLPNTIALSSENLRDEKILLIENGMQLIVWIGTRVEKSSAEDIIAQGAGGRLLIRGETAGSSALTKSISERGKRVAKMIERICSERRGLSRPQVVLRSAPGAGGEAKYVIPMLIEDRGNAQSYVDYLRHVHKRVMDKMANDSAQSDMQTWEMLNHGY